MTRFCNECGNQLADDAAFCNKCGAPVVRLDEDVPAQAEPELDETTVLGLSPDPVAEPVFEQESQAEETQQMPQAAETQQMPQVEQTQQMPQVQIPAQPQPQQAAPVRYCNNCGSPLEAGAAFCMQCGTPINAPAGASDTAQYQAQNYGAAPAAYTQEQEKKPLIPTWVLGVIAAVLVIGVGLFVFFTANSSPSTSTNTAATTVAAEISAATTEAATTAAATTAPATTEAATTAAASTAAASTAAANDYVNGIGNESTEYILPESQTRVYSTSELSVLSTAQLELARNEIYARHGREFKTDYISAHFKSKSWYHVEYSAEAFDAIQESVFSSIEKQNIDNIKAVEATR